MVKALVQQQGKAGVGGQRRRKSGRRPAPGRAGKELCGMDGAAEQGPIDRGDQPQKTLDHQGREHRIAQAGGLHRPPCAQQVTADMAGQEGAREVGLVEYLDQLDHRRPNPDDPQQPTPFVAHQQAVGGGQQHQAGDFGGRQRQQRAAQLAQVNHEGAAEQDDQRQRPAQPVAAAPLHGR